MTEATTYRLTDEQLDEIVRRLVAALAPQRIILFGSHAYGAPGADSDVDLLIVVDEASQLTVEFLKRAHTCLDGSFLPVELHFRSRQNFERRSRIRTSLEHEISTRGRVLYGA
jgi:predicted nucleotidyltransferase